MKIIVCVLKSNVIIPPIQRKKAVCIMLIYSTRFRVALKFGKNEFVKNIIEWNQGSRYPVDDIEENTFSFIAGDDDNCLEVTDLENERVIAARMHIKNNGGVWNTDIILNYGISVLSVYVNKNVAENTVTPSSKAFIPAFVTQIIKKGYADKSMGLDITDKPLSVSDRELLLNAVNTSDKYSLPLVYLSSRSEISAEKLAAKLAGLASVVTDGNDVLKESFPEPIYIFFPHQNTDPLAFGTYPYHRDIQWKIFDYLNSREYNRLETWDGLQNEKSVRINRELLKKYKSASDDNEALTEMLEEEMEKNARFRDELSYENNRLVAEAARLALENERLRENGTPLLMRGSEEDMYADEQREIVIDSLKKHLANSVDNGSRRGDILKSVIEVNPVKGTPERYKNILKKALEGYKTFETPKIKAALKETGIEIIEHTGHYKIALRGDHRYVCEAAATCSDSRGGNNLISEINKKMF